MAQITQAILFINSNNFRDLPDSLAEADHGRGRGGGQTWGQPDHQPPAHGD